MLKLLFAVLILLLFGLLLVHFVFTLYAIFRGAAFVPTPNKRVKQFLELAEPGPEDTFLDLGSGDGRVLIAFARAGVLRCRGVEINPILFLYSWFRVRLGGYRNITVRPHDIWVTDLSEVDIMTMFFVPILMEKMKQKIQREMKPGSRVLSYRYEFSDWSPEKVEDNVRLYVVPER